VSDPMDDLELPMDDAPEVGPTFPQIRYRDGSLVGEL